jgi:hypothetical protein
VYSFLEKKGLAKEEIDESFCRVSIRSFFVYVYIVQKLLSEND